MIQIPQSTAPLNGFAFDDPAETAVQGEIANEAAPAAPAASGDPIARFGGLHGMHADVQRFAYASPDGSGSAGGTGATAQKAEAAPAKPVATEDPASAAAVKEAQALMDAGIKLLREHRYDEAIAKFEEGFRTYPDRGFILNKASTLFDAGRYAEAKLEYEQYLAEPNAPRAEEARAMVERANARLGGQQVTMAGVVESRRLSEQGAQAYKAGRFEEALDAFEKAYALNPMAELELEQASCLERLGRPYAAADGLESYLSAKPDAKDATKLRSKIEKLRAEADKKPITAVGAGGGQEWITRGNRLLAAHRYNEALEAYREGFRTYPDQAFILNEAAALLDAGRYEEADLAYQRYLANPDAPRAKEARVAQERARAHMNGREANVTDMPEAQRWFDKAEAAFKAGRYDEALAGFERAYDYKQIPEYKFNQAVCLERLGRSYAAVSRYGQYLAERPDAADAGKVRAHIVTLRDKANTTPITASGQAGGYEWMTRGLRMTQLQRFNEAVNAFQEGFRTYPDRDFIRYEASALLQAGRYAEADLAFQTYLADPQAPHADTVRGEQAQARSHMGGRAATATGVGESMRLLDAGAALFKAGRFHDALQAYERAYSLNPLGLFRFNQAACLDKLGKRELAAQRYAAYLEETPNASDADKVKARITKLHADAQAVAQAAFDRAQADFSAGRFKQAAAGFAEAYEQKPFPQFLFNIAASYDKAGDRQRAVQNYQLYLSMAPDAADADKVRNRIHRLLEMDGNALMKP